MSQPIRKDIKEKIGEPEKKIYTLLIDGNNLLRQAMVDTKVNGNGIHYGGIFQSVLLRDGTVLRKLMHGN